MELRIRKARTTRDIDLALRPSPGTSRQWKVEAVTTLLRRASAINLADGFKFAINDPTLDLNAAPCMPFDAESRSFSLLGPCWNVFAGKPADVIIVS